MNNTLTVGGWANYLGAKSKIYKIDEARGRVLIAVLAGFKNWVPIEDCLPWIEAK